MTAYETQIIGLISTPNGHTITTPQPPRSKNLPLSPSPIPIPHLLFPSFPLSLSLSIKMTPTEFSNLSPDLIELILSYLPIPSILRAASVCKAWLSIISSPAFPSHPHLLLRRRRLPWLFLLGLHNTSSRNHQSFAFDPSSSLWFRHPTPLSSSASAAFLGSDGFLLTTAPSFSFSPVLRRSFRLTSPLRFSRINPLVAALDDHRRSPAFLVVGGVRFIGNLVDIEEDRLAAEIYHPSSDSWELAPPLPADFRSGNSSQSLSSALFRDRFYVLGIYSSFVSSLDLRSRAWSSVQRLRPPGLVFSFLVACEDRLVLAGIRNAPAAGPSFSLWSVDEETMECAEIAVMPRELLDGLFDGDEDDKFASLKCVGLGNLIYVFNEEYHRKYPACVCELRVDSEAGGGSAAACSWRRVPPLPYPVNKFHKVISFCSKVSLANVLGGEEEGDEDVGPTQAMAD